LRLLAEHLADGMSISPLEARQVYGIERLSARVHELSTRVTSIAREARRDALDRRYTRYYASSTFDRQLLRISARDGLI
jgi:hypothetical protein